MPELEQDVTVAVVRFELRDIYRTLARMTDRRPDPQIVNSMTENQLRVGIAIMRVDLRNFLAELDGELGELDPSAYRRLETR